MAILTARNLKKHFGETAAVDGLSFEVAPGEIFGVVGPDGAGKTTALRLLISVLDADEGTAVIDGIDVAEDPDAVREQVGYMPQHFSLYRDLTVAENLHFFADMYFVPKKKRKERLAELYAFSRLEPFADRPAGKLSGGMQKKLGVSCCMIHTPKLLLLDEPTTGVDPVSRRELWEILYRFADRGVSQVVCTPYMDEAERCHRVGLMHKGRFLVIDTPQAIIEGHKEQVFELTGVDLAAAREALSGAPGLQDVYPFGDALHIAADAEIDVPGVVNGLIARASLSEGSLARVRPTFEDVFMAKIREVGK
jgi:ABC-2 type transport system ATP-binding protein